MSEQRFPLLGTRQTIPWSVAEKALTQLRWLAAVGEEQYG